MDSILWKQGTAEKMLNFKCSVKRRVNFDFSCLVYLPEGFILIAGDLLVESASFEEAN